MKKNIDIKNLKVAKRYASALSQSVIDNLDEALGNMALIDEVIFDNEEFKVFFSHPIVSLKDKKELLHETLDGKINSNVLNFIQTLLDENRFSIFRTIFELFKKEVDNLKNMQRIDILSAIELEEYQKENLKNKLAQKLNKDVILSYLEDKEILGGLVVKYEDKVIDLSLKNKFDLIRQNI